MEQLLGLIPTIGFPAVCLIACGIFIYKIWRWQVEQHEKQIAEYEKREERTLQHLNEFSVALNNFNVTLCKIDTRLEVLER